MAIILNGLVHLDPALNFGEQSAPGIWGNVANAMVEIYLHQGLHAVLKLVDDFLFFHYPLNQNSDGTFIYPYNESLIWGIAERLGWPWAHNKFLPFASSFRYIGFLWSILECTVQLLDDKKAAYLDRLLPWLTAEKMKLEDTLNLIGTLNHVCLVAPAGRGYLVNLYNLSASFKDPKSSSYMPHTITSCEDLEWWETQLCLPFLGLHIIWPLPQSDILIFVDASTFWGIGLFINGRWLAWEFKPGWCSPDSRITHWLG